MESKILNVDILLRMSPINGVNDIVTEKARDRLLQYLTSLPPVRALFQPQITTEITRIPAEELLWYDFNSLAVLLVSKAIVEDKDQYGIYQMIDEDKLDLMLQEKYSTSAWKKMGFTIYTRLFRDLVIDSETQISFGDFINDNQGPFWAKKLIDRVNNSHWLTAVTKGLISGKYEIKDYHRDMNYLFLKIHMLDAMSVIPALQIFSKALPDLRLELVTTDYLYAPLDLNAYTSAIAKAKHKSNSETIGGEKSTCRETVVHYGLDVVCFVLNQTKSLELWTGIYANNRRTLITEYDETDSCNLL